MENGNLRSYCPDDNSSKVSQAIFSLLVTCARCRLQPFLSVLVPPNRQHRFLVDVIHGGGSKASLYRPATGGVIGGTDRFLNPVVRRSVRFFFIRSYKYLFYNTWDAPHRGFRIFSLGCRSTTQERRFCSFFGARCAYTLVACALAYAFRLHTVSCALAQDISKRKDKKRKPEDFNASYEPKSKC